MAKPFFEPVAFLARDPKHSRLEILRAPNITTVRENQHDEQGNFIGSIFWGASPFGERMPPTQGQPGVRVFREVPEPEPIIVLS